MHIRKKILVTAIAVAALTLAGCATSLSKAQSIQDGVTCMEIDTATLFSIFTATATIRQVKVQGTESLSVVEASNLLKSCFGTDASRLIDYLKSQVQEPP